MNTSLGLCLLVACSVYDESLLSRHEASPGSGGKPAGFAGNTAVSGTSATLNAGGSAFVAGAGGEAGTTTGTGSGDAGGNTSTNAGAGGEIAAAGVPGTGGAPTLELIDDMEDGNAFVRPIDKRDGHWDVGHDDTSGATQEPASGEFTMKALADEPTQGNLYTAYTKGRGFSRWGAFMTVSMRTWPDYNKTPTYDASAYTGISFYAKVGEGSDKFVRVRFISADTDPRGGNCSATGTVDVACYDHYLADVELGKSWQRYDLKFSDFKQLGVGKQFERIDLGHMYALEFFFPSRSGGNSFEVWVDDLNFVLK